MQFSKLFSFIAVALLVAVVFAGVVSIPAAAQTDTMQFHYNAQHTGDYSPVAGSTMPNNKELWHFSVPPYSGWMGSPSVANGIVYAGSQDGNIYALDATTSAKVWSFPAGGAPHLSTPAVVNGVVYLGEGAVDNSVYALDATDGHVLWNTKVGGIYGVNTSPVVANGVVYVGSYDKNLYALDATDGHVLWSYTTGGLINGSPTVADGVVYVGSTDHYVYALSAENGAFRWRYLTPSMVEASPAVYNGVVYIASTGSGTGGGGTIHALNAQSGQQKWSFATQYETIRSCPAVVNGFVYVQDEGYVYALDATDGHKLWADRISYSDSPSYANGVVYVTSGKNVYALDATTGAKLWDFDTGEEVGSLTGSGSVVYNGVVYLGSMRETLFAIGNQTAPPPNQPPVANAGPDQTVTVNTKVTLDGTASTDPDNNLPLTYQWTIQTKPAGSTVALSSTTAAKPTFTPDKAGEYVFALNVTDSLGLKCVAPDTVKITATSTPITATTTTITASNTNPSVGQSVTFTFNLKAGTAGLSKSVKIWHTTDGVTWQDGMHTTTNGVYAFTQVFGTMGERIYHAEFAGDSQYGASSDTVTVNVGTAPTPTPSASPTVTPSVSPSASPSASPTVTPSVSPSASPSVSPTVTPSATPSASPTVIPTTSPTPPVKPSPEFPLAMAGAGTVMLVIAGIYVVMRRRR